MSQGRAERVAELIRQEVAKLLIDGFKDPRLGFVSVMNVRMSKDLRYATVYVSLYGSDAEKKSSLAALRHAEGWFRRQVSKYLRMRVIPEIRFAADDTLDRVYHLEDVIEQIHEHDRSLPMARTGLGGVLEELRGAGRTLVVSHVHPDGDAVGSMLAMAQLLRALGKTEVYCALADPVPAIYAGLPGAADILGPDAAPPETDTVVVVDVATRERLGAIGGWVRPEHRVVIVDHHLADAPEGHVGCVDATYAATGEMVADLFEVAGVALSPEAALCAYVAQTTDTGGFRFSNTNARSHRIAARLLDCGIDVAAVSRSVFDVLSKPKALLLRLVLDRMEFRCGGRVAHSYIAEDDFTATGGKKEDLNGLVNYCSNIEGVRVGILFNAVGSGTTKASFRSTQEFNSAAFLQPFGGGGHAASAGITLEQPLEEVRAMLLEALDRAMGRPA